MGNTNTYAIITPHLVYYLLQTPCWENWCQVHHFKLGRQRHTVGASVNIFSCHWDESSDKQLFLKGPYSIILIFIIVDYAVSKLAMCLLKFNLNNLNLIRFLNNVLYYKK